MQNPTPISLADTPFMRACGLKKNTSLPIWLMRQAGRYMAEYQKVRRAVGFKKLCTSPALAAEVTVTAAKRLGVDAAIIFSDILLIAETMGLPLTYQEKIGPVFSKKVVSSADVKKLRRPDIESDMPYLAESIRQVRTQLPSIPLIGFCGAPFTMASYMIEGRGSKNYIATKRLMHSEPQVWDSLMKLLANSLADLLNAQIAAGCQAVQIFDSWAGALTAQEYQTYVLPYTQSLIQKINKKAPLINFGSFSLETLPLQKKSGGQVLSIDWRVDISKAAKIAGSKMGIQGNLDPVLLFSKPKVFLPQVKKILDQMGRRPGFIFNLGHGILPETPVDHVITLVDFVHDYTT